MEQWSASSGEQRVSSGGGGGGGRGVREEDSRFMNHVRPTLSLLEQKEVIIHSLHTKSLFLISHSPFL